MNHIIVGKNTKPMGETPAFILINPKYAHNVASVLRTASSYGFKQVWYTGTRVRMEIDAKGKLPREERMRGYNDVQLINYDYPFDHFPDATPVAVELSPNAENLLEFEHPENPIYVFGPEDGHIGSIHKKHCHRFLYIPTHHCLNLANSVATVAWEMKRHLFVRGVEPAVHISQLLKEDREWTDATLYGVGGANK